MKALFLGLALLATGAQAAEAQTSSSILRATLGKRHVYVGRATTLRLSEIVSYADFDSVKPLSCTDSICNIPSSFTHPAKLCLVGAQDRACAALSRLAKNDLKEYANGDHTYTKLLSCRALTDKSGIAARFISHHDWEVKDRAYSQLIERCN
jgi:hypothetical protein